MRWGVISLFSFLCLGLILPVGHAAEPQWALISTEVDETLDGPLYKDRQMLELRPPSWAWSGLASDIFFDPGPVLGVETGLANVSETLARRIARTARRVYRALEHSGYARLDLRLTEDERLFVIEANPNPDLALDEDFAEAAHAAGLDYAVLIQRILNLGERYRGPGLGE